MKQTLYILTICRDDDEGNLSSENKVFTDKQEAIKALHEIHESELNWFNNAVYDTDSVDDSSDDSSFDIFDMDCSGLKSTGSLREFEIEIPSPVTQEELLQRTNKSGTQLKMMTLEDFMKENNLTAAELARQLDCAKSRICNYLRGETQVTKSFRNLVRAKYNIEII